MCLGVALEAASLAITLLGGVPSNGIGSVGPYVVGTLGFEGDSVVMVESVEMDGIAFSFSMCSFV